MINYDNINNHDMLNDRPGSGDESYMLQCDNCGTILVNRLSSACILLSATIYNLQYLIETVLSAYGWNLPQYVGWTAKSFAA